jgi:hypothetical protein
MLLRRRPRCSPSSIRFKLQLALPRRFIPDVRGQWVHDLFLRVGLGSSGHSRRDGSSQTYLCGSGKSADHITSPAAIAGNYSHDDGCREPAHHGHPDHCFASGGFPYIQPGLKPGYRRGSVWAIWAVWAVWAVWTICTICAVPICSRDRPSRNGCFGGHCHCERDKPWDIGVGSFDISGNTRRIQHKGASTGSTE